MLQGSLPRHLLPFAWCGCSLSKCTELRKSVWRISRLKPASSFWRLSVSAGGGLAARHLK